MMSDEETAETQAEELWQGIKQRIECGPENSLAGEELEQQAVAIWEGFCDQLKQAGPLLMRKGMPKDELNLSEGLRHLVRQIRMGFEISCEYADTQHPQIAPAFTSTMLAEGITSDCRYSHAIINGQDTYRVTGRLGTAPLFEFATYTGKTGIHDASQQVAAITEAELDVAEDGSFEFLIGPDDPQKGNWLKSDEHTNYLFIREYAHDLSTTEPSHFKIESESTEAPKPLDLEQMARALELTSKFVQKGPKYWTALVDGMSNSPNVVHVIPAKINEEAPTMPIGHQFAFGYYKLKEDEALLVEFQASDIPYWAVQLTNCWFEPIDFDGCSARINNKTASIDEGNKVALVITDKKACTGDEGPRNLIDHNGHNEGTLVFRWSRTSEPVPKISTTVVKLTEL